MTAPTDDDVFHPDALVRVQRALDDLAAGRMVILVDDEDRENEGDLVVAAEHATPEAINFMATHGRGLICLSLTGKVVDKLGLPMMATQNQSPYNTAFTVSIEAREGVSTGISAADRARTIAVAIDPASNRYDLVTPGHVFPLKARDGGVLERVGQTEGSVDLARIAGLNPSAVICEIMNPDGTMARLPELIRFGKEHGLRICAVADLIKHRMQHERIVASLDEGTLDVPGLGTWNVRLYHGTTTDGLHLAVWKGALGPDATLARVQGAPPAWTFLSPDASNLAGSARKAMTRIDEEGRGALVLMHLRGLDNAMLERTFAYDVKGEAPSFTLPAADALRDLGAGCQILRDLGLASLRLLTNSNREILGVEAYGLTIEDRVPLAV